MIISSRFSSDGRPQTWKGKWGRCVSERPCEGLYHDKTQNESNTLKKYAIVLKTQEKGGGLQAQERQRVWMSAKEAAAYVGIAYPKFTALGTQGRIPRTLIPETKRTYRYNRHVLDEWMLKHQES